MDKRDLNTGVRLMDDLNGVVTAYTALYDPSDGYFNTFFLIGFYRDVEYNATHPEHVIATVKLESI